MNLTNVLALSGEEVASESSKSESNSSSNPKSEKEYEVNVIKKNNFF